MPLWPSELLWNLALQTVNYLSSSIFVFPVLRQVPEIYQMPSKNLLNEEMNECV